MIKSSLPHVARCSFQLRERNSVAALQDYVGYTLHITKIFPFVDFFFGKRIVMERWGKRGTVTDKEPVWFHKTAECIHCCECWQRSHPFLLFQLTSSTGVQLTLRQVHTTHLANPLFWLISFFKKTELIYHAIRQKLKPVLSLQAVCSQEEEQGMARRVKTSYFE